MRVLYEHFHGRSDITKLQRLKGGVLRIWTSAAYVAEAIYVDVDKIEGVKMTTHIPTDIHMVRGVIIDSKIPLHSYDDLSYFLKPHRHVIVRRMPSSPGAVVDFFVKLLPTVKVGWAEIPVRPYTPPPLRCRRCQKFGLHQDGYRNNVVCVNCADIPEAPCTSPKNVLTVTVHTPLLHLLVLPGGRRRRTGGK